MKKTECYQSKSVSSAFTSSDLQKFQEFLETEEEAIENHFLCADELPARNQLPVSGDVQSMTKWWSSNFPVTLKEALSSDICTQIVGRYAFSCPHSTNLFFWPLNVYASTFLPWNHVCIYCFTVTMYTSNCLLWDFVCIYFNLEQYGTHTGSEQNQG